MVTQATEISFQCYQIAQRYRLNEQNPEAMDALLAKHPQANP